MLAGVHDKPAGSATVMSHHACMRAWERVGSLTIADPLPRLAGHLVANQGARSKPMWHVRWGECAGSRMETTAAAAAVVVEVEEVVVVSQQRRQCAGTS